MRDRRGFGLVELAIAVAIVGITTAMAVAGTARLVNWYRLNGAAAIIRTDLQAARMAAIKTNQSVTVDVNTSTQYSYSYVDSSGHTLSFSRNLSSDSPGVTITMTGSSVTFTSQGLAGNPGDADKAVTAQGVARSRVFSIRWTGEMSSVS